MNWYKIKQNIALCLLSDESLDFRLGIMAPIATSKNRAPASSESKILQKKSHILHP